MEDIAGVLAALTQGTLTAIAAGSATAGSYPFKTQRSGAQDAYYGTEILITSGTVAVPNPNGIAAHAPSTGVFTPALNWSTTPDATATFDIFRRGLTRALLLRNINLALRELRYVDLMPVTLIPDGDAEVNDTNDWTARNSATLAKITNGAYRGSRSLQVTGHAATANGAAESVATAVNPSNEETEFIYCVLMAPNASDEATVIPYDVTNSVAIVTKTHDKQGPVFINGTFTIPATCESFAMRLGVSAAADVATFDDIIVLPSGGREVPLDFRNAPFFDGQARALYEMIPSGEPVGGLYGCTWRQVPSTQWHLLPNFGNSGSTSAQPYRLFTPPIQYPLYLEISRAFATLSADSDTTSIDREWIRVAATVRVLEELSASSPAIVTQEWKEIKTQAKKRLAVLNQKFMPRPVLKVGGVGFNTPAFPF